MALLSSLMAVSAFPEAAPEALPQAPNVEGSAPELPKAPVVKAIDFEGNDRFGPKVLRGQILTRVRSLRPWVEKPRLDESVLQDDMERIVAFYEDNGFYEALARYEVERSDDGRSARVRIFVSEGPGVVLERFTIELATEPVRPIGPDDELGKGLALVSGEPFSAVRYREARAPRSIS